MSYTPLDSGLPYSSVNLDGGPTATALWSVILASTDRDGVTAMNPRAAHALWANSREPKSVEEVQAAWDWLAAPDERSKNPAEGGRRIVPTPDGRWRVVSHERYREKHSGAFYRSQAAVRQARRRERLKAADCSGAGDGIAATEAAQPAGAAWTGDPDAETGRAPATPEPEQSAEAGPLEQRTTYARAVNESAVRLLGREITNGEYALALSWLSDGIPLRVALGAIERCAHPEPGVEREPRTLHYFDPAVQEEFERWKRASL